MNTAWPTSTELANRLELALQNPAHAYIFSGHSGYGARLLANYFSARLVRADYSFTSTHLAHSNIIYIQPEEGKKKISITQVHNLIYNANQTRFRADVPRVFIIDRADQFSREAATALLKTLEEPSPDTIFILTSYSLHTVLPTIRSRAVTITLPKLSDSEIQQFLINNLSVSSVQAGQITEMASGKIELATQLVDGEKFDEYSDQIAEAKQFINGTLSEKFAIAKQVADKQNASNFLDRLCYTLPVESSILVTAFNQERIVDAEKQIGSNVNQRFVLENLALHWTT